MNKLHFQQKEFLCYVKILLALLLGMRYILKWKQTNTQSNFGTLASIDD